MKSSRFELILDNLYITPWLPVTKASNFVSGKKGAKLYTFLWDIPTWRTRPIELQLLLGKKCRAFSTCNSSSFSIWQCHPHASCRMFVHMSSASSYWSLPKGIHQHPPKPSWNQNPSAADGVMTGAWKPLSAFSLKDVDSACRIGKQIFH